MDSLQRTGPEVVFGPSVFHRVEGSGKPATPPLLAGGTRFLAIPGLVLGAVVFFFSRLLLAQQTQPVPDGPADACRARELIDNDYVEQFLLYQIRALRDLPEAHLDLAAACCRERNLAMAERHACEALSRGYALPGLARNILGCVAASRGQFELARTIFRQALEDYPHAVVQANRQALEDWLVRGGPASPHPLLLRPDAVFETNWLERQPENPVSILPTDHGTLRVDPPVFPPPVT